MPPSLSATALRPSHPTPLPSSSSSATAAAPSTNPVLRFLLPPRRSPLPLRISSASTPPPPLRPLLPVSHPDPGSPPAPSSSDAVAAAIRRASPNSPVDFVHRVETGGDAKLVLPSPDFHRLCLEQLDLFRMVVDRNAVLSVYVRPAGSYVMDQLELRRVVFYPKVDMAQTTECVILIANFGVPAGLRAAEAALSNQLVDVLPDHGAVVLPMVKHPFIVGVLVAEVPLMEAEMEKSDPNNKRHFESNSSTNQDCNSKHIPERMCELQAFKAGVVDCHQFTEEQRSRAVMISRSLAMAYVMDQKAILLQQSSWQNNVRMSQLVEQIRAPLTNIRTLSKILSTHAKRSEISYDIIEDILIQGEQMKDTLRKFQDAIHFTKANIIRYNEETLKKLHGSSYQNTEVLKSLENSESRKSRVDYAIPLGSERKDTEMPMPPLALTPQHQNIRPCNVSDILEDLVGAALPLANKQQRLLEFVDHPRLLLVAVEESALRQALSNLIEGALLRSQVGGRVQIMATGAPAGGILIVVNDDGPDMHYMTQMHSLAPFGSDLFSDGMVEDNMTWNFVAGLTVSREILESYGCVVRVISPRIPDAALGTGGTRIELWLPTLKYSPNESFQDA